MLTRRENLLIRPWQERRYIYHREKIKYALPAIDNTPPPQRPHVSCKLKKIQKEAERCSQIVNDNFTLLQHLSNIMSTTRVDHFWEEPPPNFLQRVGIYKIQPRSQKKIKSEAPDEERPATRKERCYGCSPDRYHKVEIIPEERTPFTPPKKRVTRKAETPPDWGTQYKFRCAEDRPEFRGKIWKKPERRGSTRQIDGEKRRNRRRRKHELMEQSECIYLSKGGLTLAVKFPSRSEVLMSNQRGTRVLQRELCECKSFPRKLSRLRKSGTETLILRNSEKLTLDTSEKGVEDKTMINMSEEFRNLKMTKEAEKREEKLTVSDGSYLFSDKEPENVEYEDSEFESEEEERKSEEIDLEREELANEDVEEEEFQEDEIDEEEVKHEAQVEEEVEPEIEVEEEEEQEEILEEEADDVVQEQIEEEHSDEELEDTYLNDGDNKYLLSAINENEIMKKVNASERKDSEEENTITNYTASEEEVELKKFGDGTGIKENECAKEESIETEKGNEELIDSNGNSKQVWLVRLPKSNQSVEEDENHFTQVKDRWSSDEQDNIIKEIGDEITDQCVYDEAKESMSLEDEYTEDPIAINEIGMKDTFSETENEVLLRGITFDTSQEFITDELIEQNKDEDEDKDEKCDEESSSQERIDQKIEKVLEDAENIISELNKDVWLQDCNSDNMEAMTNDDKLTDKEVPDKNISS